MLMLVGCPTVSNLLSSVVIGCPREGRAGVFIRFQYNLQGRERWQYFGEGVVGMAGMGKSQTRMKIQKPLRYSLMQKWHGSLCSAAHWWSLLRFSLVMTKRCR